MKTTEQVRKANGIYPEDCISGSTIYSVEKAMEEYAAQFKVPDITEGEIEDAYGDWLVVDGGSKYRSDSWKSAIKWYREWLQSHPTTQPQAGKDSGDMTTAEMLLKRNERQRFWWRDPVTDPPKHSQNVFVICESGERNVASYISETKNWHWYSDTYDEVAPGYIKVWLDDGFPYYGLKNFF